MKEIPKLVNFNLFYANPPLDLEKTKNAFIGEVAGKDSIAAIVKAAENNRINGLLGIGIFHRAFYGNESEPIEHFSYIRKFFDQQIHAHTYFLYLDVANLFDRLIVQNMAIVQKYFGYYSPCPPCHLFFHMMRIPIATYFGATKFITGERELHGNRKKLNQLPEILSLFKDLLAKRGIELIQPIRKIKEDGEIFKLLGTEWKSAEPFNCIFSKNYYDETGEISFDLHKIIKSITDFYFPLFSATVTYIEKNHKEPEEKWYSEQIEQVIVKIK